MWAKVRAVGNALALSTGCTGARSASSTCPQPGLRRGETLGALAPRRSLSLQALHH